MNLKDEACDFFARRLYDDLLPRLLRFFWLRLRAKFCERIDELKHAKFAKGRAEIDGRHMALAETLFVEIWIFLGELLFLEEFIEQIIIIKHARDGITVDFGQDMLAAIFRFDEMEEVARAQIPPRL